MKSWADCFYTEPFPMYCAIDVICDFRLTEVNSDYYESGDISVESVIADLKKTLKTNKLPLLLATTPDTEEYAAIEIALSYCGFDVLAEIPSQEANGTYNIKLWAYFR